MSAKKVCLDTSVIIPLILLEKESEDISKLYYNLIQQDFKISAPKYLITETYSVVLKQLNRKLVDSKTVKDAFNALEILDINLSEDSELLKDAFEIGKQLNLYSIYDCIFLAFCIQENIPFVTLDKEFLTKARTIYAKVYSLKDAKNVLI